MPRKYTPDDFITLIDKTPSCWIWKGNINPKGYGRFSQHPAHRYSYELHVHPIPKGPLNKDQIVVRHTCDTPCCVNPDHLELGTRTDNNHDRHKRGRSSSDKLTELQARDIKYNLRHTEAMRKYPFVSETTITRIRKGLLWKHI